MRLANYKRGYSVFFDCSIHGSIYCTVEEWRAVKKLTAKVVHSKNDFFRYTELGNGRKAYNIRVTATELVAETYGLTRYKRGNYLFIVSI